jgi:cytochrome oxidase Cu insertion factor (SCO1/SenC/PrrC family)
MMTSNVLRAAARSLTLAACVGVAVVATAAGTAGRIAVGDPFPRLEGDLLSGKPAALPDLAKGHVAVVALGFTYDARFAVEAWEKWYAQAVGAASGVSFYQVPMMGRAARMGRFFIDRGMRKNTPKEAQEHVLTVYSDTGPWKTRAGYQDARERDAYLFLLDPDGVVRWTYTGPFDDRAAADLKSTIESLAGK